MSAPVDVLGWIRCQPCKCMSVAQLGERDPGCERCRTASVVLELIEAAAALDNPALFPTQPGPERLRLSAVLDRVKGCA